MRGTEQRYFMLPLHLAWKPGQDMEMEGSEVDDTDAIRKYADRQQKHLHEVADEIDKLRSRGWDAVCLLYDIECSKICTRDEVEADLRELGMSDYIAYLIEQDPEEMGIYFDEEGNVM
jgi:hypothetical protein